MQRWDLHSIEAPDGTRDPDVLISEDEGRAVLIRLQPGQELGEHQVKEHTWIVVVEGTVQVRCDGEEVEAGTGTLFRFQPDERHAIASEAGGLILLLLYPWPGEGHYRGEEKAASRSA